MPRSGEYADEPWFKVSRRIFKSSVWEEDPATRIVWLTLLHLAQLPENRKHGHGMVLITRGNLAREAYVDAEQLDHALARLTAPDPTSRTEPDLGRIEILKNGYFIRSFDRYHDADEFDRKRHQRIAAGKARAAQASRDNGKFTSGTPATAGVPPAKRSSSTSNTETETETDTTTTEHTPAEAGAGSDGQDSLDLTNTTAPVLVVLRQDPTFRLTDNQHGRARCPSCGKDSLAVGLHATEPGAVLLCCHGDRPFGEGASDCDVETILGMWGLDLRALYPQPTAEAHDGPFRRELRKLGVPA